MAARKRYSTEVAAYLDQQIAAAQAGQAGPPVSEQVGFTVAASVWRAFRRRILLAPVVVALLPLAAIGLGVLVRALGQPGLATAPALAALLVLAVFLPWRAWQVFRRARGLPPALSPFSRLRWRSTRSRMGEWYDLPSVSRLAEPLLVGFAAVPALLVLIHTDTAPAILIGGLVALPIVLSAVWEALAATISGLGAVGGVAASTIAGQSSLAHLDERLTRLTQMRDWLRDDTLRAMVDDVIGRQVRASERRQVAYSAVVGVVSLIAGWLLSGISPIFVASFFHR